MTKRFDFENIDNEVQNKTIAWFHLANIWRVVDYMLGVSPFIASISVIYIETTVTENKTILVVILSAASAVLSLLSFAIEPKKHMRNYRKAFYEGYRVIVKNITSCGKQNEYLDALLKGELIIGATYDVEEYHAADDGVEKE